MIENQWPAENKHKFAMGIKERIAIALIVIGTIIGGWIILNVFRMYHNPMHISKYQQLVKNNISTTITIKEKEEIKVIVTPEIISYIIPIFLLIIGVSVAGMFIKGGIKLLSPEIGYLKKNINTNFEKLTKKIDQIKF